MQLFKFKNTSAAHTKLHILIEQNNKLLENIEKKFNNLKNLLLAYVYNQN